MDKLSLGKHISHQFNMELEDVQNKVMHMGGLVEKQLQDGLTALLNADIELGEQVAISDFKINALEVEIDEECNHIIAKRQPAASDLRVLLTIIKTITDLERIGDEAEKLGQYAMSLSKLENKNDLLLGIEHLGSEVINILHASLDAFTRMDVEKALEIAKEEEKIDRLFDSVLRELMTYMMEDPRSIKSALKVLWCARALERIGDHAQNICEYIVYMVVGKDIRHTGLDKVDLSNR